METCPAFNMDDREELMPEWLNLVEGVVDSKDMPLNVARETLQRDKILRMIKKSLVKNCLEMFAGIREYVEEDVCTSLEVLLYMKLGILDCCW